MQNLVQTDNSSQPRRLFLNFIPFSILPFIFRRVRETTNDF